MAGGKRWGGGVKRKDYDLVFLPPNSLVVIKEHSKTDKFDAVLSTGHY